MKLLNKIMVTVLLGIVILLYVKIPTYASAQTILGPEVTNYLASRNGTVSVGVYDASTGTTYTYNSNQTYLTESVVKMSMLADVLYQKIPITDYENSLLTKMIENSDNSAASTIWRQLGSDQNVQSFFRKVGMTNTIAGTGGWWGHTTTNVLDQLTMMKYFAYPNALLTDAQRAYGLNLMQNVQLDQRWGTSYGIPAGVNIALKNGWVTTGQYVNSVGFINGKGKNYVIAVLTTNNKSLSYGIDTINTISSLVWNEVPRVSIGVIDAPLNNSAVRGQNVVRGWVLDENGVSKVEVMVDGTVDGQAFYGDSRPDVQSAYPEYNNGNAGYHYTLDTTKFSDGQHTVTVRETGANGHVTTISNSTITIANNRGYMDTPVSGTTLKGTKNVSGWFLDEDGVASIEVIVDGAVAGQAVYGDTRSDVQKAFPEYSNGNAGYHYALDTGQFSDGQHNVTIKETDKNGRVTTLPGSTITIANHLGYMDTPVSGTTLKGTKNVSGWFLDEDGVASIEVIVDGAVAGQAVYGDTRSDVQKAFPEYSNGNAGYHYALDTGQFSDGQHNVTIKETDKNGRVTTLPGSTITIANHLGYMDTPVSGTTLKGTKNVSGWFLDEDGVASIEVIVDGAVAGQAVYGDSRSDVQKAFPEYSNGNAGYHYALDTGQFSDGQHNVTIKETDKNGRVTTLPGSTITIANHLGYMDTPVSGTTLKGTKNVSGWFLDKDGVVSIEVMVDGAVVGKAVYGDSRPDVQKAFPEYSNGNAGYHYVLDTAQFSDGQHTVTIKQTDKNGRVTILPENTITISNVKGYIDNPVSGTTLRGTTNVSGWFLDTNEVAAIEVMVDGTVTGQAVYGDSRVDVQKAFPEYNNGNAGYHYALDTTKFSNGQHTVAIREMRRNGSSNTLSVQIIMDN